MPPGRPELDLELLAGLPFACRPDCGLCCFASPRVSVAESEALRRIVPDVDLQVRGRDRFVAARPNGGACPFLTERRCRVHAARPAPCREFPVEVHVGERLQASLVLSCPGIDLGGLTSFLPRGRSTEVVGLEAEVASVLARVDGGTMRRVEEAARRRRRLVRALEAAGRWVSEAETRRRLDRDLPTPIDSDFGDDDLPRVADGLERLPLFFDGRAGPVGMAAALGGSELLVLAAEGGVERSLGVYPPVERAPRMTADGARLLEGYLRYWLARDRLFGTVLLAMADSDEGDVPAWTAAELRAIAATTLSRAVLRARSLGVGDPPLGPEEIARGIRATDQDLLDRPTWGDRL